MRPAILWLAKANQSQRLNPKAQGYAPHTSRLGRVIMDFRCFISGCDCVPASMAACCLACPGRREELARLEFFCGTVADLDWVRFTPISPRSRSAHGAHGSTSVAHDARASADLAWRTLEAAAATPGAKRESPEADRPTTPGGTH